MSATNLAMNAMLAKEFEKGMKGSSKDNTEFRVPPLGWYASEKFDGYRCLIFYEYSGRLVFISRAQKEFNVPDWFKQAMPSHKLLKGKVLDGELWAGRENFQMMGTVRKKIPVDEEWLNISFNVYDITNDGKTFLDRQKDLINIVKVAKASWNKKRKDLPYPYDKYESPLVYTEQKKITSIKRMEDYYKNIIDVGGEGIMLKHPLSLYKGGRSSDMLKYKPSFDREGVIVDYKPGKGKYKDMLGGFVCKPLVNHDTYMTIDQDPDHEFTLSGMDDDVRLNYKSSHPVGTIITYECSGFTDKGIPRFGRYVRIRTDVVLKDEEADSSENLEKIIKIFKAIEKNHRQNGGDDVYRAKAYTKTLQGLKSFTKDSDLTEGNLSKISGLGKGLKDKIRLIVETGTCPEYEKVLGNKGEITLKEVFQIIHGVGPGAANKLIKAGFKSIEELEKCEDIGEHLNDVQMKGLKYYEDVQKRIPFGEIRKLEEMFKDTLEEVDNRAELTIAGSYRRRKDDSGDIDILLKATKKDTYEKFIDLLKDKGYLVDDLARGSKKYMGMGKSDMSEFSRRIDIMYTRPQEYPFAVLYFTGSADFNVKMRNELLERGYTLNEYGVKFVDKEKKFSEKFKKEKDIFDYFGYDYVEPWNR
jgi:DNA polymerase/3'-5' exonuclease PolX